MKNARRTANFVAILLLLLTTVVFAKPLDVARSVGQVSASNPLPVTLGSASITVGETTGAVFDATSATPAPPPSTPVGDCFRINGSATTTVYIREMSLSVSATTAAPLTVYIAKRSTAGTGGVSVASIPVPRDSTTSAATAVVVGQIDNTTYAQGTLVGNVWVGRLQMSATSSGETTADGIVRVEFDPPIQLHGVAQSLSWYIPGAMPAGATCYSNVTFSEIAN